MSEAEKQDRSGEAADNKAGAARKADDVQDEALGEVKIPDSVMEAAAEAEKSGNKGGSQ